MPLVLQWSSQVAGRRHKLSKHSQLVAMVRTARVPAAIGTPTQSLVGYRGSHRALGALNIYGEAAATAWKALACDAEGRHT